MARIPDATRDRFPPDLQYVWERLSAGGGMPNIYRAMGNNPELLRAYTRFGNALWNRSGLDAVTRELAILRVASRLRHEYEWHQHVRIARAAGVTAEQINAIHDPFDSPVFSDAQRAMFAYLDKLVDTGHPSRGDFDRLAGHFPVELVVAITLLGAFYVLTATFLTAMEVETEEPFTGWTI